MRKLSEIVNEDALDLLADIIDPMIEISADQKLKVLVEKKDTINAIKFVIKEHKKSILTILAILDGEDVGSYKINVVQIPTRLFQLLNDEDIVAFFDSQGLKISGLFSGSATESTGATEEK